MGSQTIARLFDSYEDAAQAVRDLEAAGVTPSDIGIVAGNAENRIVPEASEAVPGAEVGAAGGAVAGGGAGVLAGLGLLAIPGAGPVVAAGWLASLVAGAVAGGTAGGIFGALVGSSITAEHADTYAESVRRGGALVTVRTTDEAKPTVDAILDRNAADRVSRRADGTRDLGSDMRRSGVG
jgi:hypothetical protein